MKEITKNTIIIILALIALSGIFYGVCTSNDVEYAQKIQQIDEQIMTLQYQIDVEQATYESCKQMMEDAHNSADEYRKEIENLNKKKAELVGLEME